MKTDYTTQRQSFMTQDWKYGDSCSEQQNWLMSTRLRHIGLRSLLLGMSLSGETEVSKLLPYFALASHLKQAYQTGRGHTPGMFDAEELDVTLCELELSLHLPPLGDINRPAPLLLEQLALSLEKKSKNEAAAVIYKELSESARLTPDDGLKSPCLVAAGVAYKRAEFWDESERSYLAALRLNAVGGSNLRRAATFEALACVLEGWLLMNFVNGTAARFVANSAGSASAFADLPRLARAGLLFALLSKAGFDIRSQPAPFNIKPNQDGRCILSPSTTKKKAAKTLHLAFCASDDAKFWETLEECKGIQTLGGPGLEPRVEQEADMEVNHRKVRGAVAAYSPIYVTLSLLSSPFLTLLLRSLRSLAGGRGGGEAGRHTDETRLQRALRILQRAR